MTRLTVAKTHKLFIGGAFKRSESERVFAVAGRRGSFMGNAAQSSRKDARDAVSAARASFPGWSTRTGYNRGQILYRVAELLEDRRDQFIESTHQVEAFTRDAAVSQIDEAIDLWVWYAGWADKCAQVLGNGNPVSGPYFNFSTPEPSGVVAAIAPPHGEDVKSVSALVGITSVLAPALVTGNTAVLVSSAANPLVAVTLSEVLATSDVPAGVVNVLTSNAPASLARWLASHADVDVLDLAGVGYEDYVELSIAAVGTVKRVIPWQEGKPARGLHRVSLYTETKTVWHTKSMV